MKYVLAAIALTIALPAAAQVNSPADPHAAHTGGATPTANADHAGHGQVNGDSSGQDMHAMHEKQGTANTGSATGDSKPGCCPDGKKMPCCEKMAAEGKKMDCCAGAKADHSSDEH